MRLDEALDLVGELEKPHRVRHGSAALADLLGDIGLGEVEAVLERFVAERLLDWIQVLSLEVLRRRHRGGRKIIGLDERDAYLLPAGDLRGAETALA